LAGICAALASTLVRHAVFLPVDLPFLPSSLLVFLLHHARITGRAVTVASVNGFDQTFPAVLSREALPALQFELAAGRGGCFSAFQAAAASLGQATSRVAVEFVAQSGHVAHSRGLPAAHWFLNLNSPAELERARARWSRRIA
jgi:molybdopterin-guanine dinucleotide biosynthesis protein A